MIMVSTNVFDKCVASYNILDYNKDFNQLQKNINRNYVPNKTLRDYQQL